MKRLTKIIASVLATGLIGASAFATYAHTMEPDVSVDVLSTASAIFAPQRAVQTPSVVALPAVSRVTATNRMSTTSIAPLPKAGSQLYTNKVVIVTFHDIAPQSYSKFVITPDQFSADLDMLARYFHVITNTQFVNFLGHRGVVPPNAVLLTFDDGYRGMYTYAFPTLLAHHMDGTFFEIVGNADKNRANSLTWDEMRQMVSSGMSIQSHTYSSHYEVKVGPNNRLVPVFDTRLIVNGIRETQAQYDTRVFLDFSRARTELERGLGVPVHQFAWPYGWGIPMAAYIAHRVGYNYLYTTANGYVTPRSNHSEIRRIDIGKPFVTPSDAVQMIIQTANNPQQYQRHHQKNHTLA